MGIDILWGWGLGIAPIPIPDPHRLHPQYLIYIH
jgi:hypothetical protein